MTTHRAAVRRTTRPIDAFPDGGWADWRAHILTVDVAALYAAAFAESVEEAMKDAGFTSNRELGRQAGVSHSVISAVRRGQCLPDAGTVARLEVAFNRQLWPAPAVITLRLVALAR